MTSLTTKAAALLIIQEFTSNFSATSVIFENEEFDGDTPSEYTRVLIQGTSDAQRTMNVPGLRRFERRGLVLAQIYVPPDRGLGRFREIGEAVRALLEAKTIGGVWYLETTIRAVGQMNGKFTGVASTPFSHDETK